MANHSKRTVAFTLGMALLGLGQTAVAALPSNVPVTAASLRETQEIELRIARIAYRLQTANAAFCKDLFPLNGLTVKVLNSDATSTSRAAHREALAMGELPTVYLVVPGSAAEHAGLVAGNHITAVGEVTYDTLPAAQSPFLRTWELVERAGTLNLTVRNGVAAAQSVAVESVPGCNALFAFVPSPIVNAETNGNRVFALKGLIDLTRNDDELAVVLAHEFAHVLLHHGYPGNEAAMLNRKTRAIIEQDADRLGLLLMSNAGYDPTVAGPWKRYSDGRSRGFFNNIFGGYGAYMPTEKRARFLDELSRTLANYPRPISPAVFGFVLP